MTKLGPILRTAKAEVIEQLELAEDQKDVADILDLLRINPSRFFGNLELLATQGNPLLLMRYGADEQGTKPTPSESLKKLFYLS